MATAGATPAGYPGDPNLAYPAPAPQFASSTVPGAASTAGGGTKNADGSWTGSDGTIYVGGADTQPRTVLTPKPAAPTGPVGPDGKPISQATADYYNELAAIAGPENMPGVDMSGYISAYNTAYNTQMSQIKAGLTASLGQVQQRRDQAAGIVAKMPAKLNSDYATVTKNEAAMNARDNAGLTGRAQADAAGAVTRGNDVLQENKQAQKDTGDYMNLGITANQQQDESLLNASANSAEANAASQRASAEEAMYMQQAQAAASYAENRQNRISQFTQSTIAAGQAPSGIPGLSVNDAKKVAAEPAVQRIGTSISGLTADPTAHSKEEWSAALNHIATLPITTQAYLKASYPDFFTLAPTWSTGAGKGEKSTAQLSGDTAPSFWNTANAVYNPFASGGGSGSINLTPAQVKAGW